MRYYWEALFSTEYFPYWEFTMLMILFLNLSMLWRLHRIENRIKNIFTMFYLIGGYDVRNFIKMVEKDYGDSRDD
tara:strand:+ start:1030 stop:1254 length:225 start_codon:yes stop_codon:yes gene_type:complete